VTDLFRGFGSEATKTKVIAEQNRRTENLRTELIDDSLVLESPRPCGYSLINGRIIDTLVPMLISEEIAQYPPLSWQNLSTIASPKPVP
jgi:hypothetical protein